MHAFIAQQLLVDSTYLAGPGGCGATVTSCAHNQPKLLPLLNISARDIHRLLVQGAAWSL